jgi:hypothetical protein
MTCEGPRAALVLTILGCLFLLGTAQLGHCQTFDAGPFAQRHVDDVVSTVLLAGTMSADVIANLQRGHAEGRTVAAVLCTGGKYGTFDLASLGLDHLFPRWRPDHSDQEDGFSKHSGQAVLAIASDPHGGGWLYVSQIGVAVVIVVLRGRANLHDVVGRLEGIAGGGVVKYGVSRIPACKGVS